MITINSIKYKSYLEMCNIYVYIYTTSITKSS